MGKTAQKENMVREKVEIKRKNEGTRRRTVKRLERFGHCYI